MTFTLKQLDEAMTQVNGYTLLEGGLYGSSVKEVNVLGHKANRVNSGRELKEYGEDSLKSVTFEVGGRYFRKEGYYSSWDNGNEFENWDGELIELVKTERVIPAQTVTEFKPRVRKEFTVAGINEFFNNGPEGFEDDWYDFKNAVLSSDNMDWIRKYYPIHLSAWQDEFGEDFEIADRWGGEGDGAQLSIVIRVGDHYFQQNGYYSSWDSDSWDGEFYEVEPYQKQVTRYRRVGK